MSIKGFEVGGVQAKYDYESLDNIPANLVQDANYVHTDNNYTNADKTKLSGIEAQANKTTIDATLTHSGQAADAKATGDAISALNAQVIASMPHDTASGSIASFPDGAAMPVIDLSVDIETVQSGSGDPSPDNIRPISGFTGCHVTRTGKNLLSPHLYTGMSYNPSVGSAITPVDSLTQFTDNGDGTFTLHLASTWESYFMLFPVQQVSGNIEVSFVASAASSIRRSVGYLDKNFKVLENSNASGANLVTDFRITPTNDANRAYYYILLTSASTQNVTITIENPQAEWGNSKTSYEPYQDQTYTIDLDGTRYGGTLDVTSGKLTVTDGYIASYNGETLPSTWISDRDVYAAGTNPTNGAEVVYKLATPIEVDLTPTEITTLLGTNNIFADCGDTTVSYYADTTLFVNKKIAAAVAALS